MFPRVHGVYAMYLCFLLCQTNACPYGFTEHMQYVMFTLCQTDACSHGFMEYMPCIYVSCYARLMRVPTGSRSICNMLCLRYARLMRVPTGSRSIYVMPVSRRGPPPMFLCTPILGV